MVYVAPYRGWVSGTITTEQEMEVAYCEITDSPLDNDIP